MATAAVAFGRAFRGSMSRDRWIISPTSDLLFIIGTPLFIVAGALLAQRLGRVELLALLVMTVLSMGHHLPGFLRIYTDPELFARYRLRFIAIPILLVGLVAWLASKDLHAVLLMVFFWGLWHGLMQVYGFARIYDAKNGETASTTAWLDWLLCVSWFLALTLGSSFRAVNLRSYAGDVGLSLPAEFLLAPATVNAVGGATVALTVLYLLHAIWLWSRGRRVSPIKLLLLTSSFALLYISYRDFARNPLVSLAMFEAFHDIQYFAIVWSYGTHRRKRDGLNPVGRFLFRPTPWMFALYLVLIVVLYGGVDFVLRPAMNTDVMRTLTGVFAVSAILHFYFDGFIWRIRQVNVRKDLQIADGDRPAPSAPVSARSATIAGWWDLGWQAGLLGGVALLLAGLELGKETIEPPMLRQFADLLPSTAESHATRARLHARSGQEKEAIAEYQRAGELNPSLAYVHYNLAELLNEAGEPTAADAYRRCIKADPRFTYAHLRLAYLLAGKGHVDDAIAALEAAREPLPDDPKILSALGTLLIDHPDPTRRDVRRAIELGERARQRAVAADLPRVVFSLARAYERDGRLDVALAAAREARELAARQDDRQLVRSILPVIRDYENRL